ncbi:HlyD family efflux transporter periplasmic adaptor subunit [Leptolyngbya sp. 'hensonii']|uniref:HlyD family efflux transporter periplasmic adaptor subunit n=1 Tax=Leptolyngbya sp. 'hensonii' TaxID=1922337 RepID=UPI0009F86F63|nr:HlyD family efflux transporter periplasmic adaptor subunit [Leptolyngbya sp. 'hensonii']
MTSHTPKFDQGLILQQSPAWSRAILWSLLGAMTTGVLWACFAKIDQAIQATGKLEPTGSVKEVKAPISGVVKTVHVRDGQQVKQGDLLITLDNTNARAQIYSLKRIKYSLLQENHFYKAQLKEAFPLSQMELARRQLRLSPEMLTLTRSRAELIAGNQLYRAQLDNSPQDLTPEQQERLMSIQTEETSRVRTAELEVSQLMREFQQAQIRRISAQSTLALNQQVLRRIEPLAKQGAIADLQRLQQVEEVEKAQAQVEQLQQEEKRLQFAIAQSRAKVSNTIALSRRDWLTQIANNNQRIAEIDSQLTKAIVENNKRIAEIDNQISQAQTNLKYQELRAPTGGTVFDLKARSPGFVANTTEPILKVVPTDALVAEIYITNQDIGFVQLNVPVDVRIDSFPFSEYGDIKGQLVWIGSDALPPDQIQPYYRFPARIKLERQSFTLSQNRQIPLQSGMSVTTNIKLRERRVISLFTDLFTNSTEGLRFVR